MEWNGIKRNETKEVIHKVFLNTVVVGVALVNLVGIPELLRVFDAIIM